MCLSNIAKLKSAFHFLVMLVSLSFCFGAYSFFLYFSWLQLNCTYCCQFCVKLILLFHSYRWLKEQRNINVVVEPRVKTELVTEVSYFSFVQTWEDGNACNFILPFLHIPKQTLLFLYVFSFLDLCLVTTLWT